MNLWAVCFGVRFDLAFGHKFIKSKQFRNENFNFCRATLLIIHAAAVRTSGRRRWTRIERVQSNLLVRFSEQTFDLATGDFD